MKRLVVTADDFGAAPEVNGAVEAAHRNGILTAASLMVGGAAAADAIERARRMPRLRVGLHLVLVDGRPTLPASRIPRLVGGDGCFRSDLATLGAQISFDRETRRQLTDEITAQFEAFRATGLALDHCNAHKHFHLHPVVGRMMAAIGPRFGARAVRVPSEPLSVLRKIEPRTSRAPALLTAPFAVLLRRRMQAASLMSPDRVFGLHWSGAMTRPRLAALLAELPDGLNEVYLHPATAAYAGSAPGYRYAEELDALTAPEVLRAVRDGSVRLGGFTDFATDATRPVLPGAMALGRDPRS
jgi:hopanoid biosynthesis associated protein HpnK